MSLKRLIASHYTHPAANMPARAALTVDYFGQMWDDLAAASLIGVASISRSVNEMPRIGHSQTNVIRPAGGNGQSQNPACNRRGAPLDPEPTGSSTGCSGIPETAETDAPRHGACNVVAFDPSANRTPNRKRPSGNRDGSDDRFV